MKRTFNHLLHNHRIIKDDELLYKLSHQALQAGDYFVEYIRARGDDIWYWDRHWTHIKRALELLSGTLDEDAETLLKSDLKRLIRSNRAFVYTCIRLLFFRTTTEEATKDATHFSYWVTLAPISNWELPEKRLVVDVFNKQRKFISPIAGLDTASTYWPRQQAKIFVERMRIDDCIILNQEGDLCESLYANLFVVRGTKVYTPGIETGCRWDVMRDVVIKLLESMSYEVQEAHVSSEILLDAEELFFVSVSQGVQSVLMFQTARYFKKVATQLVETLINQKNWI